MFGGGFTFLFYFFYFCAILSLNTLVYNLYFVLCTVLTRRKKIYIYISIKSPLVGNLFFYVISSFVRSDRVFEGGASLFDFGRCDFFYFFLSFCSDILIILYTCVHGTLGIVYTYQFLMFFFFFKFNFNYKVRKMRLRRQTFFLFLK